MATTSLGLGDHWDQFVTKQVASGRYDTANEVIREALRALEALPSTGKNRHDIC